MLLALQQDLSDVDNQVMAKGIPSQFESLLSDINQLIVEGSVGAAREKILNIKASTIPRSQVFAIADLARRVGMAKHVILLLAPYVQSGTEEPCTASAAELALYALALGRLGAYSEGETLLKKAQTENDPLMWAYRGHFEMSRWNTRDACASFKKFLSLIKQEDYFSLVAEVNLSACLMDLDKFEECEKLIQKIWVEMGSQKSGKYKLLYANTLEILAQMHFRQKKFGAAEDRIDQAFVLLKDSRSRYEFYTKKWKAILNLYRNPDRSSMDSLLHIRSEALKTRDWETIRDCDTYSSFCLNDEERLQQIYIGSPDAYRKRLKHMGFTPPTRQLTYLWNFERTEIGPHRIFDLNRACEDAAPGKRLNSKLLLNLFRLLCQDFYRPMEFGYLISLLYPGEYYNPETTPKKASQVIGRLRVWFAQNDIPLEIEIEDERVKLISKAPYTVRVHLNYRETGTNPARSVNELERFRTLHFESFFTVQDLQSALDVSKSSALRLIKDGIGARKVRARSTGKGATYEFIGRLKAAP